MSAKRIKLSDQIRMAVKSAPLNRNQISLATGIDPGVLCRFVAGKVGLLMQNLDKLADVLNISIVADAPEAKPRTARKAGRK